MMVPGGTRSGNCSRSNPVISSSFSSYATRSMARLSVIQWAPMESNEAEVTPVSLRLR